MKKKIALFGCGWSNDYVTSFMRGIEKAANKHHIDVYLFMNYASFGQSENELIAETAILNLPDLKKFDGAIILGNILNSFNENILLQKKVKEAGVPTLYVEYEHESIPNLKTDNRAGMTDLMEHLFTCHHIKKPWFFSGPTNHQESNLRKEIFENTCKKYGCSLTEDSIIICDWTERTAHEIMEKILADGKELPDTIVCANDNMAFGVLNTLQEAGYSIPDDIIVTGYDTIEDGFYIDPILTSVSSNSEALGEKAIYMILDEIAGKPVPKVTTLDSKVEIRQSCGCHYEPDEKTKKMIKRSSLHYQRTDQMNTDIYFRSLYGCIREITNIIWLHYGLRYFYKDKYPIEGHDFMICLEPKFDSEELSNVKEFSPITDVIYYRHKDTVAYSMGLDLFPKLEEIANSENDAQFIVFLPLHMTGVLLGFAIFHWSPELLNNFYLYIWSKHMAQNLDLIRHNLKINRLNEELKKLSYTDPLTGVYNRIGCEDLAMNLLKSLSEKNAGCAVIMADLDKMKNINDKFGHTQGDFALRVLAQTIRKCCPEDYVISRYGGDEFLIVGPCDREEQLDQLIQNIYDTLAIQVNEARLPYQLSCSIGGYLNQPGQKTDFKQCIEKADQVMYKIKAQHHKMMGNDSKPDNQ